MIKAIGSETIKLKSAAISNANNKLANEPNEKSPILING